MGFNFLEETFRFPEGHLKGHFWIIHCQHDHDYKHKYCGYHGFWKGQFLLKFFFYIFCLTPLAEVQPLTIMFSAFYFTEFALQSFSLGTFF